MIQKIIFNNIKEKENAGDQQSFSYSLNVFLFLLHFTKHQNSTQASQNWKYLHITISVQLKWYIFSLIG